MARNLSEAGIMRLARIGGVKSLSGDTYGTIRWIINEFVETLTRNLATILDHSRRKTVKLEDVIRAFAFDDIGRPLAYTEIDKASLKPTKDAGTKQKQNRSRPGVAALREIAYYQKNAEGLQFQLKVFERLVRESMSSCKLGAKFSSECFKAIQCGTELFVIDLFQAANLQAIHAKRQRVKSKDIELAQRMMNASNVGLDIAGGGVLGNVHAALK